MWRVGSSSLHDQLPRPVKESGVMGYLWDSDPPGSLLCWTASFIQVHTAAEERESGTINPRNSLLLFP